MEEHNDTLLHHTMPSDGAEGCPTASSVNANPIRHREMGLATVAVLMGVSSTYLVCSVMSLARGGAWLLCTIVGTGACLIFGRQLRVFLTAVFCLAFYLSLGLCTMWFVFREQGQPGSRDSSTVLIVLLITFLLGVAVPVAVARFVTWLTSK